VSIAGLQSEVTARGERIRLQEGEIEALQLKVNDLKGHLTRLDQQLAAELEREEALQVRLAEEQRKERQLEASLEEERRKEAALEKSLAEEKRKEAELERSLLEERRKEAALELDMQQRRAEERLRDLRRAETLKVPVALNSCTLYPHPSTKLLMLKRSHA
jgi:chromosome segregation ATPase